VYSNEYTLPILCKYMDTVNLCDEWKLPTFSGGWDGQMVRMRRDEKCVQNIGWEIWRDETTRKTYA
jgi:hypothetical protein